MISSKGWLNVKEYRKVVQFYYKEKLYNMYLDKKNKHYFLRVGDDGRLFYVTIEELLELTHHFNSIPLVMNVKRDSLLEKIKIIPKVLLGGSAISLSLITLMTSIELYSSNKRIEEFSNNYNHNKIVTEDEYKDYLSYNYDDEETLEDLVVDTYIHTTTNNLYIYDMEYLDMALDYKDVTLEQINEVINNNSLITPQFKKLLGEFCQSVEKKYPTADLRVMYENLKSLEVVECTKEELVTHSLSFDSYGCYVRTENKIYVLKDNNYEKGTWAYQVIMHEFGHCLRTAVLDTDDRRIRVQIEGQNFSNTITAEALNSLFTVSLFDYEEKDIAYQLQSNYHSIFLECMDNYDLSDYVNHSISYYAKKLDEFNNDDNYATVILELIQMQYDDYHSDRISVEQSEFHPIYEYISDMYYGKYISSEMSYDEAVQVTDQLLSRIMFDVPEEYNIDTEYFYNYLNEYCNKNNINISSKSM